MAQQYALQTFEDLKTAMKHVPVLKSNDGKPVVFVHAVHHSVLGDIKESLRPESVAKLQVVKIVHLFLRQLAAPGTWEYEYVLDTASVFNRLGTMNTRYGNRCVVPVRAEDGYHRASLYGVLESLKIDVPAGLRKVTAEEKLNITDTEEPDGEDIHRKSKRKSSSFDVLSRDGRVDARITPYLSGSTVHYRVVASMLPAFLKEQDALLKQFDELVAQDAVVPLYIGASEES